MFKKSKTEHPGITEYTKNLPTALGLKEIRKGMAALESAYDKNRRDSERPCEVHNQAAALARKQAGIKGEPCNRGLARPITGASKFNEGK